MTTLKQHQQVLNDLIAAGGSVVEAAKAAGNIPRTTMSDRVQRARRALAAAGIIGGPPIPDIAKPPEGFVVSRNSGEYDDEGNLRKQWIETRQGNVDGYKVPDGFVVKGESTLVDANGNVIVQWIKTGEGKGEGLIEGLRAAFAEFDGAAPAVPFPAEASEDDLLTVYVLPDLHLGMHAWGKETGSDYDTKIAVDMALSTYATLVEQSRPSKHAVLLGLGDYFHANDDKAVTPRSGNKLDVDGRWPKVFAAGAKLATSIVDIIARKHQQVEAVFLPGNHDPDAAISLTVALALFYSASPRIQVHQEPGLVWYRRFGSVLLGATHGHTMKPDRMAMMLAADRPEEWGQTKHRHFFFGHIHHESALEVGPVRVESFSAPAARDSFNQNFGFRSGRAVNALTFHNAGGEIGRHRVNIPG